MIFTVNTEILKAYLKGTPESRYKDERLLAAGSLCAGEAASHGLLDIRVKMRYLSVYEKQNMGLGDRVVILRYSGTTRRTDGDKRSDDSSR